MSKAKQDMNNVSEHLVLRRVTELSNIGNIFLMFGWSCVLIVGVSIFCVTHVQAESSKVAYSLLAYSFFKVVTKYEKFSAEIYPVRLIC